MNLNPANQVILYGLEKQFKELIDLYNLNNLPSKILLSGQKGSGKCTLAYHFINYALSLDEDHSYDVKNLTINKNNKSYILTSNKSNPNLDLIDVAPDKKSIDINQIRNLISNINKSSFNSKSRFILIDNIEYLNVNSINALLKILEEPHKEIYFILIHNNKKILPTLKSRCLNFKINLTNLKSIQIVNKLLNKDFFEIVNKDLINYYFTPGNICNLINFSKENDIDISNISLKDFIKIIIKKNLYKKDETTKVLVYELIEFYLSKNKSFLLSDYYDNFLNKINNVKKFNLDEESLFIDFASEFLNG